MIEGCKDIVISHEPFVTLAIFSSIQQHVQGIYYVLNVVLNTWNIEPKKLHSVCVGEMYIM
jgi:hypothetical protein